MTEKDFEFAKEINPCGRVVREATDEEVLFELQCRRQSVYDWEQVLESRAKRDP